MKIGDDSAAALPRTASQTTGTRHAGAWQAQLERAWMDMWRSGQAPAAGHANLQGQERAAHSAMDRQMQHGPARSGGRPLGDGDAERAGRPPRPQTAGVDAHGVARLAAVRPTTEGRARADTNAVACPITLAEERIAPAPGARAANEQDAVAGRAGTHEHPGAPTSREQGAALPRSALQVAVVGNTAQVTLRDAALTNIEAARVPESIARQLLESGLRSVRLYINGRLSHHSVPAGRKTPDSGADADSIHVPSLERK
jgi:hypothetical protein